MDITQNEQEVHLPYCLIIFSLTPFFAMSVALPIRNEYERMWNGTSQNAKYF